MIDNEEFQLTKVIVQATREYYDLVDKCLFENQSKDSNENISPEKSTKESEIQIFKKSRFRIFFYTATLFLVGSMLSESQSHI